MPIDRPNRWPPVRAGWGFSSKLQRSFDRAAFGEVPIAEFCYGGRQRQITARFAGNTESNLSYLLCKTLAGFTIRLSPMVTEWRADFRALPEQVRYEVGS